MDGQRYQLLNKVFLGRSGCMQSWQAAGVSVCLPGTFFFIFLLLFLLPLLLLASPSSPSLGEQNDGRAMEGRGKERWRVESGEEGGGKRGTDERRKRWIGPGPTPPIACSAPFAAARRRGRRHEDAV